MVTRGLESHFNNSITVAGFVQTDLYHMRRFGSIFLG